MYGLCINTPYSYQGITINFFCFGFVFLVCFDSVFLSVYRMLDSYNYDDYSCLDKLSYSW